MRSALGLLGGIAAAAVLVVVSVFVLGIAGGLAAEGPVGRIAAPPVAQPFRQCVGIARVAADVDAALATIARPAVVWGSAGPDGLEYAVFVIGDSASTRFAFDGSGCLSAIRFGPPPF